MPSIPLIRGRYIQSFVRVMDRLDACPRPLLDRHGIPDAVLVDPDAVHPAHQLWAFAADAARHTGLVDLGLRAARVGLASHGAFGSRVTGSATLGGALDAFCAEARKEYSRAVFRVTPAGSTAWFIRERIDGRPDEKLQVELYVVELMLETVRLAAGCDWLPREIHLQSEHRPGLGKAQPLSSVDVRFGCLTTAIPIPRRLLAAPLVRGERRRRDSESVLDPKDPVLASDFVGALKQILATYLVDGPPRIEVVAKAVRCSVRTLQRRLHAAGLSYSRLIEDVRLSAAADSLREAGPKLVDIAFDAGYSDQANFTRAFRRWAGVPPSQFRRMSIQGAVGPHPQ